jgi:hypothetical protein
MADPTPTPQSAGAELLGSLISSAPATSARRLGAAAAAVAIPFAAGVLKSKFGVELDTSLLVGAQAVLGAYITQSVLNTIHERAKAAAVVGTPEAAVADLNRGVGP